LTANSGSILITGANGLLGHALTRRLRRHGRMVVGIDRTKPEGDDTDILVADLLDLDAIFDVCARHAVEKIVHCGGVSGRAVSRDDPLGTIQTNVMGTANVFEAARKFQIERVLVCSSGSVYGRNDDDPVREDSASKPLNAYGASKVASEAIMNAYAEDWKVTGLALRFFQVFGPRRTTRCHIKTMIQAALEGKPAFISHGPETRCQYVYVEDAVDALAAAIDARDLPARIYNISGGTSLTLRQVADIVSGVMPGLKVQFGNDPAGGEYRLRNIDLSAARRHLGFVPRYSLAAGVAAYAESLKEQSNS
jgi:UDP-glucuronate 4-epimerase